jgi:hypothetical protein
VFIDPLRLSVISQAVKASNDFAGVVARTPGTHVDLDATVIDPISHGGRPSRFFGKRNIGRCIFENSNITSFQDNLGKFDALLCGSNWNANILRARTNRAVNIIFEGIDPSLFCQGPRSGLMHQTSSMYFGWQG